MLDTGTQLLLEGGSRWLHFNCLAGQAVRATQYYYIFYEPPPFPLFFLNATPLWIQGTQYEQQQFKPSLTSRPFNLWHERVLEPSMATLGMDIDTYLGPSFNLAFGSWRVWYAMYMYVTLGQCGFVHWDAFFVSVLELAHNYLQSIIPRIVY